MDMAQRSARSPQHEVRRTRASAAWVGLVLAVLFLVALIIFIAQNGHRSEITFLAFHAHVATGLALLIAAVGGALVTLLAGSVRILQLRRIATRHQLADSPAAATATSETPAALPEAATQPAVPHPG